MTLVEWRTRSSRASFFFRKSPISDISMNAADEFPTRAEHRRCDRRDRDADVALGHGVTLVTDALKDVAQLVPDR
jgi:hypothetical protein